VHGKGTEWKQNKYKNANGTGTERIQNRYENTNGMGTEQIPNGNGTDTEWL